MINQALIKKLNFLFEQQDKFLDHEGSNVIFEKKEGASSKNLEVIKSNKRIEVPQDYLDFLKYTDGCNLYKYQDIGGFAFLGTKEMNHENKIQEDTYEDDWNENLTVFCNIIGDGDFISFRKNSNKNYDIIDCYHDESPKNWKIIDDSFENFLEKLIESKGERFWLK